MWYLCIQRNTYNINADHEVTEYEHKDWIELTKDKIDWQNFKLQTKNMGPIKG
jgi:hypothetical protein